MAQKNVVILRRQTYQGQARQFLVAIWAGCSAWVLAWEGACLGRRNSAFVYADERRNFGAGLMGVRSSKVMCGVQQLDPYGRKGQTHKVLMREAGSNSEQK